MRFCPKCGMQISDDEHVLYCPNCGSPIVPTKVQQETITVNSAVSQKRQLISLRQRLILFGVCFVLALAVTSLGTFVQLDLSIAQEVVQDASKLVDAIKIFGVQTIFGNNFMHDLIMFIPVVGPAWAALVLYNTGAIFAAYGLTAHVNPFLLFISLFITPFVWMEYISYGLAISESIWLIQAAFRRSLRSELNFAAKLIVICAVLLLLGAYIELAMI